MWQCVKYSGIIAVGLTLAGGLTACGGGMFSADKTPTEAELLLGQEGRTLWESNLQYVKIVNRDMAGIANEHPAAITSDEMRTVLSSLYVSERLGLKKQENPVFSASELQILSAALASGLAQSGANEDITFVTIGLHPAVFAKESKTNTGRVFISGGRLNIIFGLIHDVYSDIEVGTGQKIDRRLNPLLPGKRSVDSKLPAQVALDKGQSYYLDPETGKERTDWLVIDIATVLAAAKERQNGDNGDISPELIEDIVRTKQETGNLNEDISNIKEILFDMSAEIERLKQQIEQLKTDKN